LPEGEGEDGRKTASRLSLRRRELCEGGREKLRRDDCAIAPDEKKKGDEGNRDFGKGAKDVTTTLSVKLGRARPVTIRDGLRGKARGFERWEERVIGGVSNERAETGRRKEGEKRVEVGIAAYKDRIWGCFRA